MAHVTWVLSCLVAAVSLCVFSSRQQVGCEERGSRSSFGDSSFDISGISAGSGYSKFIYQFFTKSIGFFSSTFLGGLPSLLGVPFGQNGVLWHRVYISFWWDDGRWPSSAAGSSDGWWPGGHLRQLAGRSHTNQHQMLYMWHPMCLKWKVRKYNKSK